ncbi:hypothetical protein FNV43_RR10966 [Rhamnella rubrinervis]|uniref:Uncharacterized protein n=1 Tax=Rhamnella rubrinervis TaxID=2594499 RepID=A0A8K0MGT8_9ROSA|nr:hypothetical protein FNV43_RR10966 [Rhamnella rubrinervis]
MRVESARRVHKKHTKTSGKELTKWKNRDIKLVVEIPEDMMRPMRANNQMLITEEGYVVHGFAPVTVTGWKDVKKKKVDELLH